MESEGSQSPGASEPGDPNEDQAILEATVAVLRRRGWGGTSFEEVASRAGVETATVERRYPSKVALVADAATRERDTVFPSFDTGSATGDLMAFVLGSHRRLLESVWHLVLPGVLADAAEDPAVSEVVQRAWDWRRDAVASIVSRGVERGEIHPETDAGHVLDMVDGPTLFRLLVTKEPLDYAFADQLVDGVIRAVGGPWR